GSKFAPSLAAAALLVLTLFVLVPAHVYLVNRSAVVVFLRELLAVTLGLSLVVGLVLAGGLRLCPPRARPYLTLFVVGVSFLFWIHTYCLVWSYEVMDGGTIPWEDYNGRVLIDAALWVAVL